MDNYAREVKFKLQVAYDRVREFIDKYKVKNKIIFDRKAKPINLNINDLVLLKDEASHKLDPIYNGPFVVKEINNCNVTLEDKTKNRKFVVHKNRVRYY